MAKRDRSKILTDAGDRKIREAIHLAFPDGYTFEAIADRTDPSVNPKASKYLSAETVSKILQRKGGVDLSSLQKLFAAFGVTLESEDYISASQAKPAKFDPKFIGREKAIAELDTLVSRGERLILIHAKGGVGKTTLARRYLQQKCDRFIEFPIAKERQNITSVEGLLEERLKQLGEEPGREFGVSLERLRQKLVAENIGIAIDNLEPALDGNGRFIEEHRRYLELLRVCADPSVQSLTLITSRECLRETAVSVCQYNLEGLDLATWQRFFQHRLQDRNVEVDSSALIEMHQAYGGNAKAMEILCSAIREDFDGDVAAYWQENRDNLLNEPELEYLVAEQFDRLQKKSPEVYKLLYRLGCYRYQDVPTVSIEGIDCLLWDVEDKKTQRIAKSLRDRGLVEFASGEYWLHPVIRAEAIRRLRESEDWEVVNRKVGVFWTESIETVVTVDDAQRAFEAYWHYIAIQNFELAAEVIVQMRENKWDNAETLGCAFYRLGLLDVMTSSIQIIIKKVDDGYNLSRLYNMLGDFYWLKGELKKAILEHKKSGEIAKKTFQALNEVSEKKFWLARMTRYSLFNTGLCKIDAFEIIESINIMNQVKERFNFQSINNRYGLYEDEDIVEVYACLSFLKSCIGEKKESYNLTKKARIKLNKYKLNSWEEGYSPLYLGLAYKNLEKIELSFEMYNQALAYAEESNYLQVKAKALTGKGELYRIQGELTTALSHHQESIEILKKIGAKPDLAEAYFQAALTYQQMGEAKKSQEHFDKAIQLFTEMEAPKQIERVQKSMDSKT